MTIRFETEKDYQKLIPPWCFYDTVEQHKNHLMLCWGITSGRVKPDDDSHCKGCEFYKRQYGKGY